MSLEHAWKTWAAIMAVLSLYAFILYGNDKKRAIRKMRRIPEARLLLAAFLCGAPGALSGMIFFHHKTRKLRFRIFVPIFLVLQMLPLFFLVYCGDYYRADESVSESLLTDARVQVAEKKNYWYFDGPSEDQACIFYPGAKVEAVAYAPLMRRLAEEGVDAFLVKMPFNLSFFGINRASDIIRSAPDCHWYICGHSLGGVAAAAYASHHEDMLDGLILLAAYPAGEVDPSLDGLLIYGSEDRVLNRESVQKAENLWQHETCILEGGNHAGFGNYGPQAGDGIFGISAREQQEAAVKRILEKIDSIKSSMLN